MGRYRGLTLRVLGKRELWVAASFTLLSVVSFWL